MYPRIPIEPWRWPAGPSWRSRRSYPEPLTASTTERPGRLEPPPDPANKVEPAAEPAVHNQPETRAGAVAESDDEIGALKDELQRTRDSEAQILREFRNYRRHAEADLARARQQAQVELLAELADTVHALELAAGAPANDPDAVREGITLVGRNLRKVFETHGLSRIPTVGATFDPTLHEAVLAEQAPGVQRGTIVRELSPGFRTDDRVVRPAKVSVAA